MKSNLIVSLVLFVIPLQIQHCLIARDINPVTTHNLHKIVLYKVYCQQALHEINLNSRTARTRTPCVDKLCLTSPELIAYPLIQYYTN